MGVWLGTGVGTLLGVAMGVSMGTGVRVAVGDSKNLADVPGLTIVAVGLGT